MKIKNDFVTNSSSTSYVIINNTKNDIEFSDFLKEVFPKVQNTAGKWGISIDDLIKDAEIKKSEQLKKGNNYRRYNDWYESAIGTFFVNILGCGKTNRFEYYETEGNYYED